MTPFIALIRLRRARGTYDEDMFHISWTTSIWAIYPKSTLNDVPPAMSLAMRLTSIITCIILHPVVKCDARGAPENYVTVRLRAPTGNSKVYSRVARDVIAMGT